MHSFLKTRNFLSLDYYAVVFIGKLNLNAFSGFGEAWFNIDEITKFSPNLKQLASEMVGKVKLLGSKSNSSEYLETFLIRCYVLLPTKINELLVFI